MLDRRSRLAAAFLVLAGLSCSSPSEPVDPSMLQISTAALSFDAIGATYATTFMVRDQRDRLIKNVTGLVWSTSNAAVATVSTGGLITAVGNGTATITATLEDLTASATVTVLQVPVEPVIVSGNFQSATHSTMLAQPVQVRVVDRLGTAMPGLTVNFAVTLGGGSVGTPSIVSDAAGLASTTWTLGSNTAIQQRATAAVTGAPATLISATALAGPATQMIRAPGNTADGQIGTIAQPVQVRPAVEVRDAIGNRVVGATVTFSVGAGGGSVVGGAAVTDNSGIATVGSWTLGASAGVNTLNATLGALTPVTFTANGVADRCAREGAMPLTLGVVVNGTINGTDCPGSFTFLGTSYNYRYEYYRIDLTARTSVAIEMSAAFDTWLSVYDYATQTLVAENDDIVSTVITNSRVGITLDSGTYLIRARGFDDSQTGTFALLARTALIGVPATVSAAAPNGMIAAPGATTAVAPSVLVLDEIGDPVPGVNVTFATVPGIGSLSGGAAVTNASGVATATSWTLAAGANVVTATVSGPGVIVGNPIIFSAKGKASATGFDVNLRFETVPTPSQLTTFSNAAMRWEAIITGDIAAQPINVLTGQCNNSATLNETVDDVLIMVRLEPIDGAGSVLGSAGPCFVRTSGGLPVLGTMQFDTADLANLEAGGGFGDVILHEMGHVLGIGTIWASKGFLQNPSPTSGTGLDTHFNGPLAVAAFNSLGGATYTGGGKVPVENSQGGAGTRNSHWREGVLDQELMTGFYDGGRVNPLSLITVQSLGDLGYAVNTTEADPFGFTASLLAEGETAGRVWVLKDDVRQEPIIAIDRSGRPVGAGAAAPKRPRKKPSR